MTLFEAITRAVRQLTDANARWALVGGLAVSFRTIPRFTRDADLAIAVANDREAEMLVHRLVTAGYAVHMSLEQDATDRLATVRLLTPSDPDEEVPLLDLLFASCGIEPEIVAGATVEEVEPGLSLPVASAAHLIAMKILSENDSRFQDRADLMALLAGAAPEVIGTARQALDLIAERGSARGKDLHATLDHFIALAAKSG